MQVSNYFAQGQVGCAFWKYGIHAVIKNEAPTLMNLFQVQVWFFNRQAKLLRKNVEMLQRNVPTLAGMKKASTEIILKEATSYCHLLIKQDKKLRISKDELMVKNTHLKKKRLQLFGQIGQDKTVN